MEPRLSIRRLSNLLAIVTGKVFTQGSLLIGNIIVARAVGVGEFGMYSAALSLVLLLDACAGAPLDYTVIRFSALHGADPERTTQLLSLAFRAKLMMAAVLAFLGWSAGPALAALLLHDGSHAPLILIATAATVGLLLFRNISTLLQAQKRFRALGALDASSGALRIALIGAAALLGLRTAGDFLGAFGAAYAVLVAVSMLVIPQRYVFSRVPQRADQIAFVRYLGATSASIILGTISGRADILFLAAAVPPDAVSHYAAAIQLASIATLLAGYGSIMAQPFLIPKLREGRAQGLLLESLVAGSLLGGVFWAAAYLTRDTLPSLLFGAAAGGPMSSKLFPILAAGTAFDLICMPVAMTYLLQLRPRTALAIESCLTVLFLAASLWIVTQTNYSIPVSMAMLATAFRICKAALYIGIVATDLRRSQISLP